MSKLLELAKEYAKLMPFLPEDEELRRKAIREYIANQTQSQPSMALSKR